MNSATISLLDSMSLREQVGQLNQHMYGWEAVRRNGAGKLVASDALKREIDRWGGLGLLYGLFRADPWSGKTWENGIRPEERLEAAQLVQETVRSRGNHGIGVLLCEEAPHGHQALGGTVLPVNLALGGTWDPDMVAEAERQVAAELFHSGVHMALVSGLDIARDPRWGRCEECFGEDPYLASRMCTAIVEGMQGENRCLVGNGGVGVVLKHLAAQGEALGGRNGQSSIIGDHDLREIHLPMVRAAITSQVLGFMAAYNDIDGIPCCANPWLLKEYLRAQNGFDGIVMADGLAVDRLTALTGSTRMAGRKALLSGVDVSLWDNGFTQLDGFGDDETVCAAVRSAAERVLALKQRFGLLPHVFEACDAADDPPKAVATVTMPSYEGWEQAHRNGRRLSAELAQECLTVLQGVEGGAEDEKGTALDRVRAIVGNADAGIIVVAGTLADDTGCFLGDYTAPQRERVPSVHAELSAALGEARVRLAGTADDLNTVDWQKVALVVHVVGDTSERSYDSEFADNGAAVSPQSMAASCGEGVDMADISLPWGQSAMVAAVAAHARRAGVPVVTVAVCGRAHAMPEVFASSDVVLWSGYGGPFGACAIVRALTRNVPVPGCLNVTLPAAPDVVPLHYNDRHDAAQVYKDAPHPVCRHFGTGEGSLRNVRFELRGAYLDETAWEVVLQCAACVRTGVPRGGVCGAFNVFAHVQDGMYVPREASLVYSRHLSLNGSRNVEWEARIPVKGILPDVVSAVHSNDDAASETAGILESAENESQIILRFWAGECYAMERAATLVQTVMVHGVRSVRRRP